MPAIQRSVATGAGFEGSVTTAGKAAHEGIPGIRVSGGRNGYYRKPDP